MLIASNLGQIVGRLMRAAEKEAEKQPVCRDRREQILKLVRERGSVCCNDLVEAFGVTRGNASVMLHTMAKAKQLMRSGEARHYRYSLPVPQR